MGDSLQVLCKADCGHRCDYVKCRMQVTRDWFLLHDKIELVQAIFCGENFAGPENESWCCNATVAGECAV
jgi:hypothetical protein